MAKEKSSATEPVWVELSDYSSLSSSDNDYSETDTADPANQFLFTNVRRTLRRRLRRRALRVSKFKNLVRKVRPASAGPDDLVFF